MDHEPANKTAIQEQLESFGALEDKVIPLYEGALLLAAMRHEGLSLDRYKNHVKKLAASVKEEHERLLASGEEDTPETRLAALKTVIVYDQDYQGDTETYDDLDNADLIRTIDRRKGMPITLSIIYKAVGDVLGWDIHGLNFPGHFILRLDIGSHRIMFDPFEGCKILQAADLRQLLKKHMGPEAELSTSYYEPATNRDILLRLQNNIKIRQIEAEDYKGALETVQLLLMIAPDDYRLQLDAGVLYARTGQAQNAITALEDYIGKAPMDKDRQDAALLLQHIRDSLN